MRLIAVIIIFILPLFSYGQTIDIKDGTLYAEDKIYCDYTESGGKSEPIFLPLDRSIPKTEHYQEVSGEQFTDVILGNQHSPYIKITAMVGASHTTNTFVYYYNITFATGDDIRLTYSPTLKDFLIKDIIRSRLIQTGFLNNNNVRKLLSKWEKKPSYLSEKILASDYPVIVRYNLPANENSTKNAQLNISITDNSIYYDNVLFATYSKDESIQIGAWHSFDKRHIEKLNSVYQITDTTNNIIGTVKINAAKPLVYILPAGAREPLWVLTTDRDVPTIIKSATKALIVYNEQYVSK